jgi:hypothetical protein
MDPVIEMLIWLTIAVAIFYICNTVYHLRTAASLFLGLLFSSLIILIFSHSLFSEITLAFAVVVGIIYAFSRAARDFRDDIAPQQKQHPKK